MKKILIIICLFVFIFSIAGVAAQDINQTIEDTNDLLSGEDTLGVSLSDDEVVGSADKGTFTDLQNKINNAEEGSTITLENDYAYDDAVDCGHIIINKDITINGNGHNIDGNSVTNIFEIGESAKDVVLNNIIFSNTFTEDHGGVICSYSEYDLSVNGCSFINSSTWIFAGGAIYSRGNLFVKDCNFEDNAVGIIDTPFGAMGDFGGGAIFVEGKLFASGSSFLRNYAEIGGGDAIHVNGVMTLINCDFIDNGGGESSSSIVYNFGNSTVSGCSFVNNVVNYRGGVVELRSDANLAVSNCSFIGNVINDDGYVVGGDDNLSVSDSIFVDNVVNGDGGVVSCWNSLSVSDCSFMNNSAMYAIVFGEYNLSVSNSSFSGNVVTGGYIGAGIVYGSDNLNVIGCNFEDNLLNKDYATVYCRNANLNIINTLFINNSPNDYYPKNARTKNIRISPHINIGRSVFVPSEDIKINIGLDKGATGNVTVNFNGEEETLKLTNGAAYLVKSNDGIGTYDLSVKYSGDNVFSSYEKLFTLKVVEATFKDLQEIIDGLDDDGVIELDKNYTYAESRDKYSGIVIRKNITIKGNGYTLDGNDKKSIVIIQYSNVTLENINFENALNDYHSAVYSSNSILNVNNCNFINNCIAIELKSNSYSDICNCSFMNCSNFNEESGVVDVGYNSNIFASDCSFVDNEGNLIYAYTDCDLTFSNCSFVNNAGNLISGFRQCNFTAMDSRFIKNRGCIFYINEGNLNLFNSCFTENGGGEYGLISLWGDSIFDGCSFENNYVVDRLRFNLVHAMGDSDISNCNFINNNDYSGTLSVYNSMISNCSFINNHEKYAGAIQSCGDVTVSECSFVNNSAHDGGTVVSMEHKLIVRKCNFMNNSISEGFYGGTVCLHSDSEAQFIDTTFIEKGVQKNDKVYNDVSESVLTDKNIIATDLDFDARDCTLIEKGVGLIKIDASDVTKCYGASKEFVISLTGNNGPVAGADVNINIGGDDYSTTTDSKGRISIPLVYDIGTYTAIVSYSGVSTTAKIKINPVPTITSLSLTKNGDNSVILTATVTPSAYGDVVFTFNGEEYSDYISDSKAICTLDNLAIGFYDVKATFIGDSNFMSSSDVITFNIGDINVNVDASDVIKYYGGPERFVVSVKDDDNRPVANVKVKININGVDYSRTTGATGQTSIALSIPSGNYTVTVECCDIKTQYHVEIKPTISGNDITKTFRNATQYYAKFVDTKGNILKNTPVEFNINGVFYTRTTNDNGFAKMNINLNPGEYIITAKNPNSGEMYSNIVTVLPNIAENNDLTKYYRNASQYVVRLLDDEGKPVGAGVDVTFNINGVFYVRTTNASGHAKLNINLGPGTYIITAMYKDMMAANTVTVLPVLEAKDLNMKYKDGSKFEAKLVDGQGKPYAGQKVTFNVNGVFYERTTDANGIARLNINLMAGEYIITSSYNGMNIANRITISS